MVPMQAPKRMEAFHEQERGAPAPPGPASQENVNRAGLEPRAPIPRFMVPMHAMKERGHDAAHRQKGEPFSRRCATTRKPRHHLAVRTGDGADNSVTWKSDCPS